MPHLAGKILTFLVILPELSTRNVPATEDTTEEVELEDSTTDEDDDAGLEELDEDDVMTTRLELELEIDDELTPTGSPEQVGNTNNEPVLPVKPKLVDAPVPRLPL